MLALEVIQRIRQMLDDGLSNHVIANRLAISVSSVKRIRKGDYTPGDKWEKKRIARASLLEEKEKTVPKLPRPFNTNGGEFSRKRPAFERCVSCGGLVQKGIPCMACSQKPFFALSFDCYFNELMRLDDGAYPVEGLTRASLEIP